MFKKFLKKEKKGYNNFNFSLFSSLSSNFNFENQLDKLINNFFESSPVNIACNYIADEVTSIKPLVYDKSKEEFIYKHPILDLLKNPNPFSDGALFFNEFVAYYLLTGNSYISVIGSTRPVELNLLNPTAISVLASSKDGFPREYIYNCNSMSSNYVRASNKKFYDNKKNELIHLRNINPRYSSNNLLGVSFFAGVCLEISQFLLSSLHNNALLQNQGTPSGLLTYKGSNPLSDELIEKAKEIVYNKFSGANNAGRTAFFSDDFDWKQLGQSIKDMDFANLKTQTENSIYKALKIPLPLVSTENMTFSNLDASRYLLYDNNILPLTKRIYSFLTEKLLRLYPNSENLELRYDEASIETLESRKIKNILELSKSNVLSDNEIRAMLGYEDYQGGDEIYKPLNLLPIGSDNFTADNRDTPAKNDSREIYIQSMKSYKDAKGNRLYTDEFIYKNADIYYK